MTNDREMELAYKLAKEWDYCPDASMMDDVIEFLDDLSIGEDQQEILLPILDKYSGSTPDQIRNEHFEQRKARIAELEAEIEQHRWIPVSERLPEEGRMDFIVCAPNSVYTTNQIPPHSLVTHWMAMPEPLAPKGGKA